jgi:hypothetical protein
VRANVKGCKGYCAALRRASQYWALFGTGNVTLWMTNVADQSQKGNLFPYTDRLTKVKIVASQFAVMLLRTVTQMRTLQFNVWHHDEEDDWSIEIGGRLYSHVSQETLDDLVEYAMLSTQLALTEPDNSKDGTRTRNLGQGFTDNASA